MNQVSVNGGLQTVVHRIPLLPFNLRLILCSSIIFYKLASFQTPLFDLYLTPVSSGISNQGLEITIYRPLEYL